VLREVKGQPRRLGDKPLAAAGVIGEKFPQMPIFDLLVVIAQRLPLGALR
jgi:hypothetical protein